MYGFIAIVLNGSRAAKELLDELEDEAPQFDWLDNIVVLSRSRQGSFHVHNLLLEKGGGSVSNVQWARAAENLIGVLFRPPDKAASRSADAVPNTFDPRQLEDSGLRALAEALDEDSSLLILLGHGGTLDEFMAVVARHNGKILRGNFSKNELVLLNAL